MVHKMRKLQPSQVPSRHSGMNSMVPFPLALGSHLNVMIVERPSLHPEVVLQAKMTIESQKCKKKTNLSSLVQTHLLLDTYIADILNSELVRVIVHGCNDKTLGKVLASIFFAQYILKV